MSSFRPVLASRQVVAASLASNYTSPAIDVRLYDQMCVQLNFTGTPTGTFAVQAALDYDPNNATNLPGTWVPLTLASTLSAAGAAGQILVDFQLTSYPFIRFVYTAGGGSGSLDIWTYGKGA